MFVYALRRKAIASTPVDGVDYSGNGAKRRHARHYPLAAEQVAAVAKSIGERYPVYELMTLFAAYMGLRAEELAGLEVGNHMFTPGPKCAVRHVTYTLTLDVYGDWIPEDEGGAVNPLPEPTARPSRGRSL